MSLRLQRLYGCACDACPGQSVASVNADEDQEKEQAAAWALLEGDGWVIEKGRTLCPNCKGKSLIHLNRNPIQLN